MSRHLRNRMDTIIEDNRWLHDFLPPLADRALNAVMRHLDLRGRAAVLGCGDERIAELNAEFRGKARATNVLSFPAVELMGGGPIDLKPLPKLNDLGDIAISYDTCVAESLASGKDLRAHVTHLLVHAILHLAGFDHQTDEQAERMEAAERAILKRMGEPDPYPESAAT